MIIKDKDAAARLSSPMNLINRLAATKGSSKNSAMSLFGIGRQTTSEKIIDEVKIAFNPFKSEFPQPLADIPSIAPTQIVEQPALADILENHESQIKLGLAHDRALDLLNRSTEMLLTKLDDVSASKLPAVISAASKTVEGIRRERNESAKNNKDREVHYHFYTPEQKKLDSYEVIDVT
jgi:hypothetical protein